ncbi:hypothetical protein VPH35_110646 [Triticum aestivum]
MDKKNRHQLAFTTLRHTNGYTSFKKTFSKLVCTFILPGTETTKMSTCKSRSGGGWTTGRMPRLAARLYEEYSGWTGVLIAERIVQPAILFLTSFDSVSSLASSTLDRDTHLGHISHVVQPY